jgi:predicted deacylase
MKISNLKIGDLGILPVSLPVIKFGNGRPKGLILALQHGGEYSPLWIIKELIKNREKIKGTLTIVPVANPLGFVFGERNEKVENKNLNRSFPGKALGDFTARLAKNLMQLSQSQDFVIDLHTFSDRQSPFIVGYDANNESLNPEIKKIVNLLKPDLIWKVNQRQAEDKRFAGALDAELSKQNIPSVFIEMPNYQLIDEGLIEKISRGIINVFNQNEDRTKAEIPELAAKYVYSDLAGIFEAKVKLLQPIKQNEVIGLTYELPGFGPKEVKSPYAGTVMTVKAKGVVRTGSKIASIGV